MITKIHLENFKGIKERQTIELKPITLLFGPNSAGKSTIIQAIHYMREILLRQNFNADSTMYGGEAIDLGGFRNLVHNHDLNLPIIIRFDLDLEKSELPTYNPYTDVDFYFEEDYEDEDGVMSSRQREERDIIDEIYSKSNSAYVQVTVKWNDSHNKAVITEYETGFNDKKIASITLNRIMASGEGFYEISDLKAMHPMLNRVDLELGDDKLRVSKLFVWFMDWLGWNIEEMKQDNSFPILHQKTAIPVWSKFINIDKTKFRESVDSVDYLNKSWFIPEFFTSVLTGPGELLKNELNKFRYIGPIREILPRYHKPTFSPNENRWSSGLGAWDLLFKEAEKYIDNVNKYLAGKEFLNSGYEIKLKEFKELLLEDPAVISLLQGRLLDVDDRISKQLVLSETSKEIVLIDTENDIELSLKDVGVGISQVIPVVVGALAQTSSILAVEQPELHIHPKMQVSLGDVFINQININPNALFILETHSEHLMLRLLRRIEETTNKELPDESYRLTPDVLSVNVFEHDEGIVRINHLSVDKTGEFKEKWPDGFFEERAQELFR